MKNLFLILWFSLVSFALLAQETFPQDAVYDKRDGHYAFTNATIIKAPGQKMDNATLVIKDGKVVSVSSGNTVPKGAVEINLGGKYIYPSFIELNSSYGVPDFKAVGERPRPQPQEHSNKKGAYSWNEAIKPETNAANLFKADTKKAKDFLKNGFGTVLTFQQDGISRGSSALVLLGDERAHELILSDKAAHHLSFKKGKSTQNYPSSLMGAIALIRQTYYDAQWYKNNPNEEHNLSLAAWNELQDIPQFFETRDWLEILRAEKISKEFGIDYIYNGNGDEYQRLDALQTCNASLVIPVNFPKAYDVEDPYDALLVSLSDMKHWELASSNPAKLASRNINFAFTSAKLEKSDAFLGNIRKAIKAGLSEDAALKALTVTPAKMIKADGKLGTLESGKIANFIISSGNIFEEKATIHHNWVAGQANVLKSLEVTDIRGKYNLRVGRTNYDLKVGGKESAANITYKKDSTDVKVKHTLKGKRISLSFQDKDEKQVMLSGLIEGQNWSGKGTLPDGSWVNWSATYQGENTGDNKGKKEEKEEKKKDEDKSVEPVPTDLLKTEIVFPFSGYGNATIPTAKTYLIKNATVWTSEKEGILEDADVLVKDGKIAQIGKDINAKGAIVIDGTGKHLTSGIIDEHSHIAISRGVNEGTQTSSAEVSIADVINSEDVNIYRQLAGGVTAAQLLHGSANPIGGQAGIIKMRWGYTPEEMKIEGADPFIKFALGENVKQSNWGDNYRNRFPQTRMGVEQVYFDHFTRAKAYGEAKRSGKPYRKDLEMETILEIMESKRFITCHSYVQSEINMLMKTAEAFGFRINTFTHILEGYKIADKMKVHGAGGSTFSDWWAYKYEVIDAIPYNGAILHEQGVVTAFNSDDAEMGRRLNQEAGKAVMYGNVSEEEAWKFVTLNPAILLHIDKQTGSIKVGKDADLVLWSDHPLSIYAQAENTFVDGIQFYSKADDLEKRKIIQKERALLIRKMVSKKKGGAATQPAKAKHHHLYHCDDIHDEIID